MYAAVCKFCQISTGPLSVFCCLVSKFHSTINKSLRDLTLFYLQDISLWSCKWFFLQFFLRLTKTPNRFLYLNIPLLPPMQYSLLTAELYKGVNFKWHPTPTHLFPPPPPLFGGRGFLFFLNLKYLQFQRAITLVVILQSYLRFKQCLFLGVGSLHPNAQALSKCHQWL